MRSTFGRAAKYRAWTPRSGFDGTQHLHSWVSGSWVLLGASRFGEQPSKWFAASRGGIRDALPESPCRSTIVMGDPALPIQDQRRTLS